MLNEYIVTSADVGERLDKLVSKLMPKITRTKVREMIEQGDILVDGVEAKASLRLKEGMLIEFSEYEPELKDIKPENIPLDIRYEDDDLLVINKPIGMVVHPANGHYQGTLVNALIYHFQNLSDVNGEIRPGIVHRIDKETSGLLMVAKNNEAHNALALQLKDKTAYRRYLALVHGEIPHNEGSIDAPIGRMKNDRKRMTITATGKNAVTHFKVLERFNGYTFIECVLETGRTHQIRVHLQYIKFPVVGDVIYGPKKVKYPMQLLHATTLTFKHPKDGHEVSVDAELPDYFEKALDNLRKYGKLEMEEDV